MTRFCFRHQWNPVAFALLLGSLAVIGLSACNHSSQVDAPSLEAESHMRMAQQLIRKGDFESAFMHLNKAMAIRPNDPSVHRDMGWLYLYTDQPEKATEELSRLNAIQPTSPEGDYLAGAIYEYLKQPKEAVRYYIQALKGSKPLQANPSLYFDIATALSDLNRDKQALSYLEKGYKLLPKVKKESTSRNSAIHDRQTNYLFAFCSTYYSLHDFKKALDHCNQAAEITIDPYEKETIQEFMEKIKLLTIVQHTATPDEEAMIDSTAEQPAPAEANSSHEPPLD